MLKLNFLGDSITEGANASRLEKQYVYRVGEILNAEVRNYGISGSRIAKQKEPSADPRYDLYFASRVDDMKNDADLVFVFGGTNDYGHGDAPIGSIFDKTADTFYGALNLLIENLLKYYKKEQIAFILPLYRKDEDNPYGEGNKKTPGPSLKKYREIIKEVASFNKIDILHFEEEIGTRETKPYISEDGLHPNDLGHEKIAQLIARYVKNKLNI